MTVDDLKSMIEAREDDYAIEKSRWSLEDIPQ